MVFKLYSRFSGVFCKNIALQLLYCAGWVHRDISEGNILAHRNDLKNSSTPWKAKLMDLEYARKFPPPDNYEAVVDPKTGTPYFMPTEILLKFYLYSPEPDELQSTSVDKYADNAVSSKTHNANPGNAPNTGVVIHNFQHDLESLWWLILWLIISHIKDQPSEDWEGPAFDDAIKRCQEWAAPIFQNVVHLSNERQACFEVKSLETETLPFVPTNVSTIVKRLDLSRETLLADIIHRTKEGCPTDTIHFDPCESASIGPVADLSTITHTDSKLDDDSAEEDSVALQLLCNGDDDEFNANLRRSIFSINLIQPTDSNTKIMHIMRKAAALLRPRSWVL
ncbi:hypothetical protein CVT25_013762 [Psilocybe cyanescens]|uniref:Protein kinase domain-containing protein n=1 Tax=Psilocybe cyanescens TaxID=93625 RepID=A0A409WTV5_PSICY|nr:hypothetical protein CVT25_013762 [Psilocybe cyanescens]